MRNLCPVLLVYAFLTASAPAPPNDPGSLIVHEWGTFTSIADSGGDAVGWIPLAGPDDLPCFVRRLDFGPKYNLWGTVRMETPVIYFYAADQMDVSVKVRFRKGLITEWFPRAAVTPAKFPETVADSRGLPYTEGTATWQLVRVQPRAADNFPVEAAGSHYYAARATDAAPIAVGPDKEKFIFYRGVAAFAPPISATVAADGRIVVKSSSRSAVGEVVLFENRGGKTTYQVRRATGQEITLNPQVTTGTSPESLKPLLEKILVGNGLYRREAQAMIATWGDAWFEEGARLFYIAPRSFVDSILPLDVKPGASEMARVFVGRIELVTRATLREVKDGLLRHDLETLNKYGRFLEPIADRVQAESTLEEQGRMSRTRQSMRMSWRAPLSACR